MVLLEFRRIELQGWRLNSNTFDNSKRMHVKNWFFVFKWFMSCHKIIQFGFKMIEYKAR